MMLEFSKLIDLGKIELNDHGGPDGTQAVVVQMSDGTVLSDCQFALDGIYRYGALMEKIAVHGGAVAAVVCLWAGGQLELPHIQLRTELLKLHQDNADALVPVQGTGVYGVRRLKDTV